MMQKTDRNYTFVVSFSNRRSIRVRRIKVSKKLTGYFAGFAVLLTGFLAINFDHKNSANNFPIQTQSSFLALNPFYNSNHSHENNAILSEGGPETIEQAEPGEEPEGNFDDAANAVDATDFTPSIYPLLGKINNEFGWRRNPFGASSYERHAGMDIDGERGDAVIAPANGVIVKIGWSGGYGNMIEIDHGNGVTTRYGHLSGIEVETGAQIVRGQEIGKVGSTGRSTGPHLHYEVRVGGEAVNPRRFLPRNLVLPEAQ